MKRHCKSYQEMNADELAAATEKYDREFVADEARPMSADDRKLFEAARKRGVGGPKKPSVANKMNTLVDHSLLNKADALFRNGQKNRSHRKAS
jgi:hypothetical protein